MRFAFTNSVWQRSSKKYNNLSFANSKRGSFALCVCYVLERCAASAHHRSNLGNKSVACWGAFSALCHLCGLFRLRRPTTTSYRPILPAAITLRALYVFRAPLLFSTSVNLKFRHFKFRAKRGGCIIMRPFWRSQKDSRRHGPTKLVEYRLHFAARKRRFSAFHAENIRKCNRHGRRSRQSNLPTTSLSPPNQQPHFFPH